jgi:hypothetical protein
MFPVFITSTEEEEHPCSNIAAQILQISGPQEATFFTLMGKNNSRVNKSANHL